MNLSPSQGLFWSQGFSFRIKNKKAEAAFFCLTVSVGATRSAFVDMQQQLKTKLGFESNDVINVENYNREYNKGLL